MVMVEQEEIREIKESGFLTLSGELIEHNTETKDLYLKGKRSLSKNDREFDGVLRIGGAWYSKCIDATTGLFKYIKVANVEQ